MDKIVQKKKNSNKNEKITKKIVHTSFSDSCKLKYKRASSLHNNLTSLIYRYIFSEVNHFKNPSHPKF